MGDLQKLLKRLIAYANKHESDITLLQSGGTPTGGTGGEVVSPFIGKSAACVGDSITADGSYVNPLRTLLGVQSMVNAGTGGQAYAGGYFESAINELAPADLIVLAGGVNDFRLAKPLGALSDCYTSTYSAQPRKTDAQITSATFYGAFYRAVYAALSKYPAAKLCIVTPYNNPESQYGNHLHTPGIPPGWPKYNTPNTGGHILRDYAQAMREVASLFGVPVADVNAESGINFATDSHYLSDGIHCTAAGGMAMAQVIAHTILTAPYYRYT